MPRLRIAGGSGGSNLLIVHEFQGPGTGIMDFTKYLFLSRTLPKIGKDRSKWQACKCHKLSNYYAKGTASRFTLQLHNSQSVGGPDALSAIGPRPRCTCGSTSTALR